MIGWGLLAGTFTAWLGWSLIEPRLLRVKRYRLALPGWPSDYPPLKLAFLSDFHMGVRHMTLSRLRQLVERTNAEKPDIVLLGGDFVDRKAFRRSPAPFDALAGVLGGLRAPLGVFGVLGNHDWKVDGEGVRRALEQAGIVMLENEARQIKVDGRPIWIAGAAEPNTRAPDIGGMLRQIRDTAPILLLVHDPAAFFDVPDRPVLTLSGHTHGGQISRLPLLGATIIMSYAPLKWAYGHIVEKGRHLLVTGGIGSTGFPLRFLMRPEIVIAEVVHR